MGRENIRYSKLNKRFPGLFFLRALLMQSSGEYSLHLCDFVSLRWIVRVG